MEMRNEDSGAAAEMPRYKCHKEVWALKIERISPIDNIDEPEEGQPFYQVMLTPADKRYAPFPLTREYVAKHNPQAGGYFVVYEDGYKSYSPAQAFESGYTLIER